MADLDSNVAAYLDALPDLLARGEGRVDLIGDGKVLGTHATEDEAMAEGHGRFPGLPFTVKQVLRSDLAFVPSKACHA